MDYLMALAEAREKRGEPPPRHLQEMPDLPAHLVFYWTAFWDLSGSRGGGMTLMPIPVSEVESYCRLFGIDSSWERRRLLRYVQAMDTKYLEHVNRSSTPPKKGPKRPGRPSDPRRGLVPAGAPRSRG